MTTTKYSDEVRSKALRLSREGHSYADIGRRLDVSPSTVARWSKEAEAQGGKKKKTASSGNGKKRATSGRRPAIATARATRPQRRREAAPVAKRRRRTAAQRRKAMAQLEPERIAVALLVSGVPLAQAAKKAGIPQAQAERAFLAASRQTAESVKDTVGVPSLKHDRWITTGGGHSGSVTREHPSQRHALTNTGLALAR